MCASGFRFSSRWPKKIIGWILYTMSSWLFAKNGETFDKHIWMNLFFYKAWINCKITFLECPFLLRTQWYTNTVYGHVFLSKHSVPVYHYIVRLSHIPLRGFCWLIKSISLWKKTVLFLSNEWLIFFTRIAILRNKIKMEIVLIPLIDFVIFSISDYPQIEHG